MGSLKWLCYTGTRGNDRKYQITSTDYVWLETKGRLFDSSTPDCSLKHGPSPVSVPQLTPSCYFHVQHALAHCYAQPWQVNCSLVMTVCGETDYSPLALPKPLILALLRGVGEEGWCWVLSLSWRLELSHQQLNGRALFGTDRKHSFSRSSEVSTLCSSLFWKLSHLCKSSPHTAVLIYCWSWNSAAIVTTIMMTWPLQLILVQFQTVVNNSPYRAIISPPCTSD